MTDEGSEQESGVAFIYWMPQEADAERGNTRERLIDVVSLDVCAGRTGNNYDEGELRLHTTEGQAVFDRNHVRGWRTEGPVDIARVDEGDDSAVTGAE